MNPFQIFLSKFYEAVIIVLMAFLVAAFVFGGVQTWRVNHYQSEYKIIQAQYKTDVAEAKAATAEAKANAVAKEKLWSEQLLKAEQNAIEKIKAANADAHSADLAANSLSKQLDKAKKRVSTATEKTIIEYVNTGSDVLEECGIEATRLAKAADGHAIDAKRLSEAWPSD